MINCNKLNAFATDKERTFSLYIFYDIAIPHNNMLGKNSCNELVWDDVRIKSFHELRLKLFGTPIMRLLNLSKTFY